MTDDCLPVWVVEGDLVNKNQEDELCEDAGHGGQFADGLYAAPLDQNHAELGHGHAHQQLVHQYLGHYLSTRSSLISTVSTYLHRFIKKLNCFVEFL